MPLTEELRLAVPRKRRGVAANLKVDRSIGFNLDTSSLDIRTDSILIGHTLTGHGSIVVTSLTDTDILHAIGKYGHDLVKIHIGLFITPRTTKNITNLDISLRRLSLGDIGLSDDEVVVSVLGSGVERTVTLGLPDSALGTGGDDGIVAGDVGVEGDIITTTDGGLGSRGSSHITVKSVSGFWWRSTAFFIRYSRSCDCYGGGRLQRRPDR